MAEIYLRERSEVYQARLKVGEGIVRRSTGYRDPEAARKEAERLEQELNAALLQDNDLLLTDASEIFFRGEHRDKPFSPKTLEGYRTSLANIVEVLGDFPLRRLDENKLETYVNKRLRKGIHVQTRRDLAFLSSLYTRARRWECGVISNPAREIDKTDIRDARKRKGHLKPHEFEKLLSACRCDDHRLFLILGAYTGMRHQEIMKLTWEEADLSRKTISLPEDRTKNSEPREIPMHPIVFDTLSRTLPSKRIGYVFKGRKEGKPQDNFGSRFRAIRKRAGMPKVRIHDLRHTFASWLLQAGVSDKTTQDLMGHLTPSMTSRYSHNSLKAMRKAVEALDLNTLSDTLPTDDFKAA